MLELVDSEKNLLSGITFHTEEIESGNLCDSDLALLNEMRALDHYLKEKYPSYNFEITGCEPKEGTIRTYNEWYYKETELERESAFIAMVETTDSEIKIKDDFYGEIIKDDVQEHITNILKSNFIPVIEITASFWEFLGKEFGEDIDSMDVLSGKIAAGNDFKIFIDGSKIIDKNYKAAASKIASILAAQKICGDAYVVVLKSADADFARGRIYSENVSLSK